MSKKYLQIQIPTPCSEDFSKMTPVEKGHFCNNCEKVVIDFSKMSDQEIAFFYKKNGGKLCGRFHPSQLNRDIRLTSPKMNSIFGKAAGLILTGVLSTAATDLNARTNNFEPLMEIVECDNTSNDEIVEENQCEEINSVSILFEKPFLFMGNIMSTEHRYRQTETFDDLGSRQIGTIDNLGPVNDFENFSKNEIIEESKLDKSGFLKTPKNFPPLGVAIKSIFPNPFIDKINLEISVEKSGAIQINLVDIAGRIVFQKEEQAERGTQQFQIEVGNLSLSGNMYILQVQDKSGNMQSQQLMRYTNHGFTMR